MKQNLRTNDGPILEDGGRIPPESWTQNEKKLLSDATENIKAVQRWFIGSSTESKRGKATPGLAGRIIDHAGEYLGKYDPPVSLSTHIINTVVVGLNLYVYDKTVRADSEIDGQQALLLTAALALHDTNKYVEQAYDTDLNTRDNSQAVLDFYFEQGDDFGVRQVLPGETDAEIEQNIRDIKWLFQRTESKEDAAETRGEATRNARELRRYCRMADGFVSKVGRDGLAAGVNWLDSKYAADDESPVQYLRFTDLEQPILNDHLLMVVKAIIMGCQLDGISVDKGAKGVLLGSTTNSVAYLGVPVNRSMLRSTVESVLMDRITDTADFDCKTEWRSFDPDILTELALGFEQKHEIIAQGYAETLTRGSGTDHEFERIPDDFKLVLPELAHLVFNLKDFDMAFEGLSELPRLQEQVRESDAYNNQTWKIGFLAEILRRVTGSVDDGYDPETLDQELESVRERVQPALAELLKPEADASAEVVKRFFAGRQAPAETLPASDEMCFLCGRPATTDYQKGNDGFYGTSKFSRRVPPEGEYKRICPVCNLEHALLRDSCERRGVRVGDDTEIAYVYYDEFLAGLSIGQHVVYDLTDEEQGHNVADPDLLANSMQPQYHLQPFYAGGQNGRLAAIRQFLDDLVAKGLKVVIGKPFTMFRPQNALFADLNPGRRQVAFGADAIESAEDRRRVSALFDLLGQVAGQSDSIDASNAYISVPDDDFWDLANIVVQHTEWYSDVRTQAAEYFEHYNKDKYMLMREVAQSGLDLYGEQYDSRHKKTKIFREAIDATLDGLSRDKDRDEMHEHVAGQVYKAARTEKYAPHTTTEKAEMFVDRLFSFLREEESLNKAALSRRRNTLTNTYLFAYDQLLNETNEESEEGA